ncbi:hypothetical protein EV426DRAFT_578218 [Tirmania nivea]|nr:hypothetical protein EV426DRAFT_578218 [Tirmania nivea]
MSNSNKSSGDGDGGKIETQSHVLLDRIYAETAPARLATPPIVEGEDPPPYEQSITPRRGLEAIQRLSGELRRNQAGSYGPNTSELPNRGDIDPMTGRRVLYRDPRTGWGIADGSNDIEIPEDEPPLPRPTRQRRARTPEISKQGLDSAYTLLTNSELPNDPTVNAMTGDYQVVRGPAVTPGQPSREYVPTGLSEGAKLRVMDADTSRNQSSVDLPSGNQSLAASIRSKASLTATKASAIGSKISDGMDKLVAKARGKKKRKPKVKKNQEEEDESEEDEDGATDTTAFDKDAKHRKGDDNPESPHPALSSRGGSATEVLNLFGFDPVGCEPIPVACHSQISALKQAYYPQIQQSRPIHHIHLGAVGRLTLQPVSPPAEAHQEPPPAFYGIASGLEKNKRELAPSHTSPGGPESQFSSPVGTTSPSLSKFFLPKVKDVNSGLLLQQEITPGKLVKVKYAYSAKRADEFELEIDLLLVILLIASDSWALGSKYEDALDYISSREEFLPPDGSKLHDPQSLQLSRALVLEKSNTGQFKGRLPMMKFLPLEAVQLVQPYEWAFQPYSATLTSLKLRSNVTPGSKRGVPHYKLHNPPPRGISRKTDLLYGENKRLVGVGYEKFVAEVLQKIIEESRFSMQRIEEISHVRSKENTPLSSPTSSGWTSSSSPTSEWSYTLASSPTRAVAEVCKSFLESKSSSTSLAAVATPLGRTLPTGSSSTPTVLDFDCGTGTAEDIVLVKLPRCEEEEMMDDDLQTLEAVDNRISKLIDGLSGKPGKKHILKESWRWATKRKEKLFKTMLNKKNKGQAPLDGERSDTPYPRCSGCNDIMRECKNAHGSPEEFLNPGHLSSTGNHHILAEETKDFSTACSMSKNSELSGQLCSPLENCEFSTSVNQNTSSRISRPSIRDLFTTDAEACVANPNSLTSRMIYRRSTGSNVDVSTLSSADSPEPRVSKANPPKLSINTQLISPIQLPQVQSATIELSNENKLASLPLAASPRQANSAARVGIHEWYRAKVNSPSSRSPDDTGVLGVGDSTISEYLRRGRERKRSNFDESEGALSPTCTKDWAARGLIAKVKRARESMRGIYATVEECDDNDTIFSSEEDSLGGKENQKIIIA